jgi:hypothetical protein
MSIQPKFCDHAVVLASPDNYVEMTCSPKDVLDAWSLSIFAHELLNKDGSVKEKTDMVEPTLGKYIDALEMLKRGEDVAKPVIGIGIMDGVEIGIGREIIAASYILKLPKIAFHVRQAQADEIKKLL